MPDPRQPVVTPNRLLLAAAIGLVLWLVAGLLFAQALPANARLDAREAMAISQGVVGRKVGDYSLMAADGRIVRLADYRDRPLLVQFIYTGCFQVCPTTTRFLGGAVEEAQRALGKDAFRVVTVGFNLPFDTPMAMREFRVRHGIDHANWEFLGVDGPTLDAMARDLGFVWAPSASGYDHLMQVTILDGEGRVYQQVYGETFELPMLVKPLKSLAAGAPAPVRNWSDLVERVRILCTIYDPRAGRYRLDYALFIEIFVGLTVLGGLLFYLGNEWRRQRRTQLP